MPPARCGQILADRRRARSARADRRSESCGSRRRSLTGGNASSPSIPPQSLPVSSDAAARAGWLRTAARTRACNVAQPAASLANTGSFSTSGTVRRGSSGRSRGASRCQKSSGAAAPCGPTTTARPWPCKPSHRAHDEVEPVAAHHAGLDGKANEVEAGSAQCPDRRVRQITRERRGILGRRIAKPVGQIHAAPQKRRRYRQARRPAGPANRDGGRHAADRMAREWGFNLPGGKQSEAATFSTTR